MDDMIVFSVYEVSLHLRQLIETSLEPMYVSGEISNYVRHSSGHIYFNLKDPNATLRCTFFRNVNFSLNFEPEDGMNVICYGKITVYEKGGSYNLNVTNMQADGQGDLAKQFELLKKKLVEEGLFAQTHKKSLPRYPERIGIVSSPTGAALQDIINVLKRRFPVELVVYPALVQGAEAPAQLIKGIRYLNQHDVADLIILTRGGGSQEDLWAFNDENLARAIYASRLPVISAVGHEIDFVISDFVADLRAPTPSAAAEIAVPDKTELIAYINSMADKMRLIVHRDLQSMHRALQLSSQALKAQHPINILNRLSQRLDLVSMQLNQYDHVIQAAGDRFERVYEAFLTKGKYAIQNRISSASQKLDYLSHSLRRETEVTLQQKSDLLEQWSLRFDAESPQKIMDKGYAVVLKEGKIVKSIAQVEVGEKLNLKMHDGQISTTVDTIQEIAPK